MNFKRGVTMVSLAIVMAITITILATVVIAGSNILSKSELKKFGTEMLQVKEAVERYKIRKSGNLDFDEYTVSIDSGDKTTQYGGENISENTVTLYIVDLAKIDVENVNYGNGSSSSTDKYLWSETTGKIYYERGYRYKKATMYYTLTTELMELIK